MEPEIEIFYYRKDDFTDYSDIVLFHIITTRKILDASIAKANTENKQLVVFEKESTPPDFWLVLKNFHWLQQKKPVPLTSDEIIERLNDIQRDVESLKDSIEDLLDEL